MESGETARGVELMVSRAGGDDLPLIGAAWRAFFLEIAVAGRVALGRREEAERATAAAEEIAASTGRRFAAFAALRARARVALDAGDARGAAERALEAATLGDELGMPIYAAAARTLAGRALAAAGESERAAAELARAAEELDARGALRYRDEAEHELRRLGHRRLYRRTRAGKADASGVESLTERELQIARLVVDRKTNSRDRRRAVPQPEDRRDPHPQPLPQARRVLARRGRTRRRARGSGSLIRVVPRCRGARSSATSPPSHPPQEGISMARYLYRLGGWAFDHRSACSASGSSCSPPSFARRPRSRARPSTKFEVPGTESQQAQDLLEKKFPGAGGGTARVVFAAPAARAR